MTPTIHLRDLDLSTIDLAVGGHEPNEERLWCVMEATAYIAGEPWSDQPQCVSPAISAFLRSWNDSLDAATRNRLLKPYVTKVIGTRTNDEDEQTRAWLATDWLVRVHAPAWLELAGLTDDATRLRALEPLTSAEIAIAVQDVLDEVGGRAAAAADAARAAAGAAARAAAGAAAWAAAGDAARDAARDAAGDAARAAAAAAARAAAGAAAWAAAGAAARAAAGAAAWAAAGAAAWAAAGDAARDAARDAAGDAARDAAGDAARDAARAAARAAAGAAARAAAGAAARAKLAPTVDLLQRSALALVDRMIEVGAERREWRVVAVHEGEVATEALPIAGGDRE